MTNSKPQNQPGLYNLVTKDELADRLNVSLRHVTNLTCRGIIPSIKLGRAVRFSTADVLAALAKTKEAAQ